ncbi:MAG: capsular exopolysaccharide family [Gemmatimonadetes bacterium]|nr:capsular exopolysaccharide family [Gemmatimonadota bacterium]
MSLVRPTSAPAVSYDSPMTAVAPPSSEVPRDDSIDLREVAGLVRRKAGFIAAITLLGTAVMAVTTYLQAPRYEANAAIRLQDTRRQMTGGIEDVAMARILGPQTDPVLSQIEILRSRTVIGRVVDAAGMRANIPYSMVRALRLSGLKVRQDAPSGLIRLRYGPTSVTATENAERVTAKYGQPLQVGGISFVVGRRPSAEEGEVRVISREKAIAATLKGLKTRPREKTDVIDLSYQSTNPRMAQEVVNGVVAQFQRLNVQQAQQQSRRRRIFVQQQLQHTDSSLDVAQLALADFRRRQQLYSSREKFAAEQAGLLQLDAKRAELEAERSTSEAMLSEVAHSRNSESLRAFASAPGAVQNPVVTELFQQFVRLQVSRDSLLSGTQSNAPTNPDIIRLNRMIASTQARITDAVRSQVSSISARIAALDAQKTRNQGQIQMLPAVESEEVRLVQQVEITKGVADRLREEYQKARIAEEVEAGQVEVIDLADQPAEPVPAHQAFRISLGLLLGLVLGGGGAFVLEHMNNAVVRREDVQTLLQIPSLTVVPPIAQGGARAALSSGLENGNGKSGGASASLVTISRFLSPQAEAYRTLRTNLLFSQLRQNLQTLLVTSAGPGEGKTTTASNLAVTYAQQGVRVLLIDCDLRRPRQHELFNTPREPGLTQLVLGRAEPEAVIHPTPVEGLFLLPAGALPPNPAELLGSERMSRTLAMLKERFDVVIVDSPPVLLAADASIIAAQTDGVLLVLRAGKTERPAARQAVSQLSTVGANVLGAVLNDPDDMVRRYAGYYSYGYGYGYGYGSGGYGTTHPEPAERGVGV